MDLLDIKSFYAQSLGVTAPWKVVGVEIDGESREVRVRVECAQGVAWGDPDTGARAEVKDWQERTWRHLDTCEYKTVISARVPRIKLSNGSTIMAALPWAEPKGRLTKRFESLVIELLRQCRTIKGAAEIARLTHDQVDGVMLRAVSRGMLRREELPIEVLGIDEKAYRKGHRYASILTDPEHGVVLDMVDGRDAEAAEALLNTLSPERLKSVKAVALDMWAAFIGAVEKLMPEALPVFDKFHVSGHLGKAVDQVRRQENKELSQAGDGSLKGSKYDWLRTFKDRRKQNAAALRELLAGDFRTGQAWALKESFRRFWLYESWAWGARFLESWVERARLSALKPMIKVANMIDKFAEGLLNHIHYPITNAGAESINSSIQALKSAAKGLPNFKSLRTRVLFFLGGLDMQPS